MFSLKKRAEMSVWPFCWSMATESFLLATAIGFSLRLAFGASARGGLSIGLWTVISAVIFAPLIETIICQVISVAVTRKLRRGFWQQVLFATAIFATAHFYVLGFVSGMTAGLVGGFYFSYTYVHWRRRSLRAAYWSTVLVHSLYNLWIFSIALLVMNVKIS